MTTLYYYHPDFLNHLTGPHHPECPERLKSIGKALEAPEFASLIRICPTLDNDIQEKIKRIHTQQHIDSILSAIPKEGIHLIDQDTSLSPGSGRAALLAVAAVCTAVDKVTTGTAINAFCAVRPPGHHAEPGQAMGFCLFNNIAIAAEHARYEHQLQRVAIIDFDVHHGNGTQAAFLSQADVLYASSHEMPNYPYTGHPSETGVGNIVNVPLTPGCSGTEFRKKYTDIILPALRNFKPELILISAGFDAHEADPLSTTRLHEDDYAWLTRELIRVADDYCSSRIVSVLEGGYHLTALGASVAAHVYALLGDDQ